MESTWDATLYIWDVEITFLDLTVLALNVLFFIGVVMLFLYYTASEDRELSGQIALAPYCNLGEGATSKFFTVKGGKDTIQRRKQGGKGIAPNKEGKYTGGNQIEVKCNYCKSSFFLSLKRK